MTYDKSDSVDRTIQLLQNLDFVGEWLLFGRKLAESKIFVMESMENYNLNTNKFDGSAKSIDDIFAEESNDNDDDDDVHCSESEDFSENEDFYFESDHLALRGNQDYRAVLRTIVILESQRIEVAKHIDKLADIKRKATQDPNGFVEKLSSQNLDIPGPINIQNVIEKYFSTPIMQPHLLSNTAKSHVNHTCKRHGIE